jgi:uncharacterized membrane protein (DUF2068 family)
MARHQPDVVIRLIALAKLGKAALLIAIGVGALSIHHSQPDHGLAAWIHAIAVDPHGKYVNQLLAKISALDAHQLREIGVGSLVYAAVFIVEGIGLMLRKAWAEVLTVIVTTSFIPLECYELVEHRSWAKVIVILANILIVLYLLRRLRREQHWPFHGSRLR